MTSAEGIEQQLSEMTERIAENQNDSVSRNVFDFGYIDTFEVLSEELNKYIHPSDQQKLFDALRRKLVRSYTPESSSQALKHLRTISKACTMCPNVTRDVKSSIWNTTDPDMSIVGNLPIVPGSGNQADIALVKILKESGFSSQQLCYTPAIRCFPNNDDSITEINIDNCSKRYLYRELQLMSPKLIVAVGSLISKLFLGPDFKITQDSGRIYWLGPWPILPVVSPGYALRSESALDSLKTSVAFAHNYLYGQDQKQ